MFQHFIVTPFNVDLGLKVSSKLLDEESLLRRLHIFCNFCFPSVYYQSNQKFKWLFFLDCQTPEAIVKPIKELQKWSNFILIFTPKNVNFQPFLVPQICQYLTDKDTHIITTWLDADDAIAKDFIEKVQKQFNSQAFEYINFLYGYQLSREGLYFKKYFASQFISLIEQIDDNILTCKVMSHASITQLVQDGLPVRQVVTSPQWIQLIHEDNLETQLYAKAIPQPLERLKSPFSVHNFAITFSQNSYLENAKNYLHYLWDTAKSHRETTSTIIGNLLALINPNLLKIYHQQKLPSFPPNLLPNELSLSEIKNLCLQQKTLWRKSEDPQ